MSAELGIELGIDPSAPEGLQSPAGELAFRARALAQAHPLSRAALAYRAERIAIERRDQPIAELADWAATAFLVGYCVRSVEEAETGLVLDPHGSIDGVAANDVARRLSAGEPVTLLDDIVVVDALDRIIAAEIAKRHEHVRDEVADGDWMVFEEYVAWWVVHGWAARASETAAVAGRA